MLSGCPLIHIDGRLLLAGDGIKISKEAEKMPVVGRRCIIILGQILDDNGNRLLHLVTRAKRNVVGYQDPPPKTGRPGRPREYGAKLSQH